VGKQLALSCVVARIILKALVFSSYTVNFLLHLTTSVYLSF